MCGSIKCIEEVLYFGEIPGALFHRGQLLILFKVRDLDQYQELKEVNVSMYLR